MALKVSTSPSIKQPTFDGTLAYFGRDAHIAYLSDFAGNPVVLGTGGTHSLVFDLARQLGRGQQISLAAVSLDADGDPLPSSRLSGAPIIRRSKVFQDIGNLAPDCLYVLTYGLVIESPRYGIRFKVPFRSSSEPGGAISELLTGGDDLLTGGDDLLTQ